MGTALASHAAGFAATPAALHMRRGVNAWPWFSLTREFPAPRTDYAVPPFQLQRPVPQMVDLQRLAQTGLDFIRLPVDPGPFLATEAAGRAYLLGTLVDAITMAHAAGLAVLVNLQANGATHHWTPEHMFASTGAPAFPQYLALVGEVAAALSHFSAAKVALEPVNEPPQACISAEWNAVQQALLQAARRAAPKLVLVATGGCGSMIRGLEALDPKPLLDLAPLLFTFHFYEPYLFTHQGAPWMREPVYKALNNVAWPAAKGSLAQTLASVRRQMALDSGSTAAAKAAVFAQTERALREYYAAKPDIHFIRHYFEGVRIWSKIHDVPMGNIVLGEFGALRSDTRYVAASAADRTRYVRDVRETAESFGLPWALWNLFDGFGLMDDASRAFDPEMLAALGLAMPAN